MIIPEKIDDKLKAAIIQINFDNKLPAGILLGLLYQELINNDFITERKPRLTDNFQITEALAFIDTSKDFRVEISDTSIVFNIVNGYKGWQKYQEILSMVLNILIKSLPNAQLTRIGLRYISEYPDISLWDNLKQPIVILQNHTTTLSQLRIEYKELPYTCMIALTDGISFEKQRGASIDIDIVRQDFHAILWQVAEIISIIEEMHDRQKRTFFPMLKDKFLKQLNPQYDNAI
jgi:uncharacterized protein (TIGR04255 family)